MNQNNFNNLNFNDRYLLELVEKNPHSVNSLSRKMGISPSNISARLPKLESLGYIRVVHQEKKGKKTMIFWNDDKKVERYIFLILLEIQKNGGEITFEDLFSPNFPKTITTTKENLSLISKAKAQLTMHFNKYLTEVRKITPAGLEFLKKYKKLKALKR